VKGNGRFARIVLFIESEAELPENCKSRLGSLALRTEKFLADGFEQWKRPIERSEVFARDADGQVQVTVVKGKLLQAKGRAALPEIRKQAINGAAQQLSLRQSGPPVIWWIFYDYPDVEGFQGGARGTGGIAINAYPKGNALIDLNSDLAEGVLNDMAIKGTIHEFGHALGLPHTGPRPALDLGNSLMGPVNKAFWKKTRTNDTRVYLNQASAAALCAHPIFRNQPSPNPTNPSGIEVEDLEFAESSNGKQVLVQGVLNIKASAKPHSVIAIDSERGEYGDYWCRSYVADIDAEGKFELAINEPFEKGRLFLSFAFDSGVTTSDGKTGYQQNSSVSASYRTENGQRIFEEIE
jgi:hypothetical protein